MWPRVASTCEESLMAWAKSPVISSSAATKRLPKLWPSRPSPAVKRWRKSREIRCSSSERATMQLRRSPGGSMLKPRRRRALDRRRGGRCDILSQTAQQGRKAGASADGHGTNAGAVGAPSSGNGFRGPWLGQGGRQGFHHDAVTRLTYARKRFAAIP